MDFLQFQHSCLVTISYNFQSTEGGGRRSADQSSHPQLLAKSKEKLIHTLFMLLNSLSWRDSRVDMGSGSLSIFAWCYSEDTRELTTQYGSTMEAVFLWLWYVLNPLQSLGDLVTQEENVLFFPFEWTPSGWLHSFPRAIPDETVAKSFFKFHIILISYAKYGSLGFVLFGFFNHGIV